MRMLDNPATFSATEFYPLKSDPHDHGWALRINLRGTYPEIAHVALVRGVASAATAATGLLLLVATKEGSNRVAGTAPALATSTVTNRASSQSAHLAALTRRSLRYTALYRGVLEW